MNITECEKRVEELYAEGTMWAEARAQWLESCLEWGLDQDADLDDLESGAYFWAQDLYSDTGAEWLAKAMEEADEVGWQ